eukprot:gene6554-7597_t
MEPSSLSSSSINQRPVLRAYLCKKGHVVKNWKLRLFVLKYGQNIMEYFVDETKETQHQPQGRVPLFNCKVTEYIHNKNHNPREFCFIVETCEGKSWIISASSKQQQVQWIDAIREAAANAEESDDIKATKHKAIEKAIASDRAARGKCPVLKLLLLGAGESGKSTVVKQMKILHKKGFTSEEKDFYRQLVQRNLLDGVAILGRVIVDAEIEVAPETKLAISHYMAWFAVYSARRTPVLRVKTSGPTTPVNTPPTSPPRSPFASPPHSPKISPVFMPAPMLAAVKNLDLNSRDSFDSDDATSSTSGSSSLHLCPPNTTSVSTPIITTTTTTTNILKSRSTTNGVVETDFKVMDVIFRIVDVAGQRGERKKWISFFEDVTAIVFVAAISEYDQLLVEDNSTNRLQESLSLFEQICNDSTFPKTSIILFLNKIDLFREKLKRSSLKICFPDYRDDQTYDKASNYIKNNFLGKKRNGDNSRHIYYHFTCATDTKSFETFSIQSGLNMIAE